MKLNFYLHIYPRFGVMASVGDNVNKYMTSRTAKTLKSNVRYVIDTLYHVSLKKLMQQGICNPEFYGDLVYKFKKII